METSVCRGERSAHWTALIGSAASTIVSPSNVRWEFMAANLMMTEVISMLSSVPKQANSHAKPSQDGRQVSRRAAAGSPGGDRCGAEGDPRRAARRVRRGDAVRHDRVLRATQHLSGRVPL